MYAHLQTYSIPKLMQNKLLHQDLIEPHILAPGGLLTLGTTYDSENKKTNFLLSWMMHMAAGRPFLQFKPSHPAEIAAQPNDDITLTTQAIRHVCQRLLAGPVQIPQCDQHA